MDKIGLITLLIIIVVLGYGLSIIINNVDISFLIGGVTMWIAACISFNFRR